MTPPPRKYAEAPATDSSAADNRPPVEDSAMPIVSLRSFRRAPIRSARGNRVCIGVSLPHLRGYLPVPAGMSMRRQAGDQPPARDLAIRPTTDNVIKPKGGCDAALQKQRSTATTGAQRLLAG